ncbi:MAG TPA: hypothetical protein VMV79_04535 [Alphaproteobacteria bacterium]|nr:hypothetical protein [Alphaproteobacteria bacterium]
MPNAHNRYFIELQPLAGENLPRHRADETRQRLAADVLVTIRGWLTEHDLADKVSKLDVTAFGQIQIACEASVINLIRNQETVAIAAIRPGLYGDNLNRRSV